MTSKSSEIALYLVTILSGIAFFASVAVVVRTKDRHTRKMALMGMMMSAAPATLAPRRSGFHEGSSKQTPFTPFTATKENYGLAHQDRHYCPGFHNAHRVNCTLARDALGPPGIPALLTQIHKPSLIFAKESTRYQKIELARILQAPNVKYA